MSRRTLFAIAAAVGVTGAAAPAAVHWAPVHAAEVGCKAPAAPESRVGPAPSLRDARSDVLVGSAVSLAGFEDPAYRHTAAREFEVVTPELEMKMGLLRPTQDSFNFCPADQVVAFAQANGMQVRGHTLIWHNNVPDWFAKGSFTRAQALDLMRDHIFTVMGHYKTEFPGVVRQWDVVNEAVAACGGPAACPLRGPGEAEWHKFIGPDYIDFAFRYAREADPDALLFYNDYAIEDGGAKFLGVLDLVNGLIARGVPIDGVGFQSHYGIGNAPAKSTLINTFNQVAALGLQVAVTELDVGASAAATDSLTNDQLGRQAAAFSNFTEACLAVATCRTLVVWGFQDTYSWRKAEQPTLFDQAYAPKPAYIAMSNRLRARNAESVVREAENFEDKAAGRLVGDGAWRLVANGEIAANAALAGADDYRLNVVARAVGANLAPVMEVRVDGVLVATTTVASTTWLRYDYALGALGAGTHRVAIRFVNDAAMRDLDIDKVTFHAPLEAEGSYTRSPGGSPVTGAWSLPEGAYVQNALHANNSNSYVYEVVARSDPGLDAAPHLQLFVDGVPAANLVKVLASSWTTYTFIGPPLSEGRHDVRLAYFDDPATQSIRRAYVDRLSVTAAPTGA